MTSAGPAELGQIPAIGLLLEAMGRYLGLRKDLTFAQGFFWPFWEKRAFYADSVIRQPLTLQ